MIFRRKQSPEGIEAAGISVALTKRTAYVDKLANLPVEDIARQGIAALGVEHPGNNDSYRIDRTGLYVADGVGNKQKSGKVAKVVPRIVSSFLQRHDAAHETPEEVMKMVADGVAEADAYIARRYGDLGSTTLEAVVNTNDPRRKVHFGAGDSRTIQERNGLIVFQNVLQNLEINTPEGSAVQLTNAVNGLGRPTEAYAARMSEEYGGDASLFMDNARILDVELGDGLVMFTDGIQALKKSPKQLEDERVAAEAGRGLTVAETAAAILALPDVLAAESLDNFRTSAVQSGRTDGSLIFYPTYDDATVVYGRVVA